MAFETWPERGQQIPVSLTKRHPKTRQSSQREGLRRKAFAVQKERKHYHQQQQQQVVRRCQLVNEALANERKQACLSATSAARRNPVATGRRSLSTDWSSFAGGWLARERHEEDRGIIETLTQALGILSKSTDVCSPSCFRLDYQEELKMDGASQSCSNL